MANPPLYAFMDEKTEAIGKGRRFMTTCVGFIGSAWKLGLVELRRIGRTSKRNRLDRVTDFLATHNGYAALTYADIPLTLVPSREIDGTADIPKMARSDNIWSHCLMYSLVPVLARFHAGGTIISDIEIYYDRKSLRSAHRTAIERTFKQNFSSLATETAKQFGLNQGRPVRVVKFSEVPGPPSLAEADRFQLGTTLPHHLCAQSRRLISSSGHVRLGVMDATERVKSSIKQWAMPRQENERH